MAEEADLARRRVEGPLGVDAVEDVVILVERGAVADLHARVDFDRAVGQLSEILAILGGQLVERPRRGESGHLVEVGAVIEPHAALS